jgi:hypothetical protein
MIRENIPSITWAYRLRDIKPDHIHVVRQGYLNIYRVASLWVGELVVGKQDANGKLEPGAILLTNGYAYRNTSKPQDIADDIYDCNNGDETVALLNPNTAASVLGKLGGSVTSKAKQKSSANNGRLGGRPKGSKNKPAA